MVNGLGWGRRLGFPTANLDAVDINLEHGVYLVGIDVRGENYKGLLFFGKKQTFDGTVSAEVFIKDFNGDICGQTMAMRVFKKIREVDKNSIIPKN